MKFISTKQSSLSALACALLIGTSGAYAQVQGAPTGQPPAQPPVPAGQMDPAQSPGAEQGQQVQTPQRPAQTVILSTSANDAVALPDTSVAPLNINPENLKLMQAGLDEQMIKSMPEAVKKLANEIALKELRVFDLGTSGAKGWILQDHNHPLNPRLVYTLPGVDGLFMGPLIGPNERGAVMDLAAGFIEKYGPKIDLNPYWDRLAESTYVSQGKKAAQPNDPVIYAFFDANCVYCHLSWLALKPYIDAGLEVRWVIVGALAPTSEAKGAALINNPDADAAMTAGHMSWDEKGQEAFAQSEVDFDTRQMLARNFALMSELGLRGTPGFVFKDAQGQVQVHGGMPKLSDLARMTNMTLIPNDHPKLARFR